MHIKINKVNSKVTRQEVHSIGWENTGVVPLGRPFFDNEDFCIS